MIKMWMCDVVAPARVVPVGNERLGSTKVVTGEQPLVAETRCRQFRLRTARSLRLDSSVCAVTHYRLFTFVRSQLSKLR
jgi:hypothetical protein